MNDEKYPFFDVPEDDVSPLFTTKLQEAAHVGCLRGVFDSSGITTDWIKGNAALRSPAFEAELRDLFATLQRSGPLKDIQTMRQFCLEHPQAFMSGRQTFYAFRIDTRQYRYYLRLFPQKGKFHIFCYQTDRFRENLPVPDFNHIYRKRKETKQGEELMPNYDLTSGGAIAASAELAHVRANQEPNQDSYNAAWLHGYADALTHAAEALEPQGELMDAIIGYMGQQHDSAELYGILHDTLSMSDRDILALGFDLPQCQEPPQAGQREKSVKKKGIHHER